MAFIDQKNAANVKNTFPISNRLLITIKKAPQICRLRIPNQMSFLYLMVFGVKLAPTLMDRFMPKWHFYLVHLNRLPVIHEDWYY